MYGFFSDLGTMMGATAEVGCTEFGELPFGACWTKVYFVGPLIAPILDFM